MPAGTQKESTLIKHFPHSFSVLGARIAPTLDTNIGWIRLRNIFPLVFDVDIFLIRSPCLALFGLEAPQRQPVEEN
jgi:hypothetical protein